MKEQKGKRSEGIKATETFEYENMEVISSVVFTEKNEKRYVFRLQLSILGTNRSFSGKFSPDIDDFTDESEIQCDVQVVNCTLSGTNFIS